MPSMPAGLRMTLTLTMGEPALVPPFRPGALFLRRPTSSAATATAAAAASRTPEDDSRALLQKAERFYMQQETQQETRSSTWIAFNTAVQPRLQEGPMCGIVALSMARDIVCPGSWTANHGAALPALQARRFVRKVDGDSANMLELAAQLGLTTQGEMLDAEHMATVAQSYFGASAHVLRNFAAGDLLRHLLQGNALCVAYDASPNHEPANLAGDHAHWALIRGFLIKREIVGSHLAGSSALVQDKVREDLFHIAKDRLAEADIAALAAAVLTDPSDLFVFAQHGKSKHEAVWPYASLRESCANLKAMDPQRFENGNNTSPHEDLEGLRDRLVVIPRLEIA